MLTAELELVGNRLGSHAGGRIEALQCQANLGTTGVGRKTEGRCSSATSLQSPPRVPFGPLLPFPKPEQRLGRFARRSVDVTAAREQVREACWTRVSMEPALCYSMRLPSDRAYVCAMS